MAYRDFTIPDTDDDLETAHSGDVLHEADSPRAMPSLVREKSEIKPRNEAEKVAHEATKDNRRNIRKEIVNLIDRTKHPRLRN
jgi:hypothetical protein